MTKSTQSKRAPVSRRSRDATHAASRSNSIRPSLGSTKTSAKNANEFGLWRQRAFLGILGVGAVTLTLTATQLQRIHALKTANEHLSKGLGSLAAETLDPFRSSLIKQKDSCRTLISAYFEGRRIERLDWASQACISLGNEIPEAFIAMAIIRENSQREAEALSLLLVATEKFPESPDAPFKAAQIYRNRKDNDTAFVFYQKAKDRAPQNAALLEEVLLYALSANLQERAIPFAEAVLKLNSESVELKLLAARVYKATGKHSSIQEILAQIKPLLEKKSPSERTQIEKVFSDVINTLPGTGPGSMPVVAPAISAQNKGLESKPPVTVRAPSSKP